MKLIRQLLQLSLLVVLAPILQAVESTSIDSGLVALEVGPYTVLGYVPDNPDGELLPLVVNLHPTGGSGLSVIKRSSHVAEKHGFAMIAPTGVIGPIRDGWTWNVPGVPTFGSGNYPPDDARNDVAFISSAIDEMKKTVKIDKSRIYVFGFSGGGRMASHLACALSDRIAAIVAFGGIRFSKASDTALGLPRAVECKPGRAIPIVAIHGYWDTINVWHEKALGKTPFINVQTNEHWIAEAPQPGTSWSYAGETALARWIDFNGCTKEPQIKSLESGVERHDYLNGRDGSSVSLVLFSDMGHLVPGYTHDFLPGQESASKINGYSLAWDMVKDFRR